jgi:hypothetical protein
MKKVANEQKWCRSGKCPCPVWEYVRRQTQCFSFEEIMGEVGENEAVIRNCLANLLEQDGVCRDGNLWCPDNPY